MSDFVIKSTETGSQLVFSSPADESFIARYSSPGVDIFVGVSTYMDPHGPSNLFTWIARQNKPWGNNAFWQDIEGVFKLSVFCTLTGSLEFRIAMRRLVGKEDWRFETSLVSKLGEADSLASNAQKFFNAPSVLLREPEFE